MDSKSLRNRWKMMSLATASSLSRNPHILIKCLLLVATASFAGLAGCAAKPELKDAYVSAPVFESTGSPGGSFTNTLGALMIERTSGDVSFCNTTCSPMAKIDLGVADRITTQPGNNQKIRFTNETRGQSITYTVHFKQTKGAFGWSYNFFNKDNEVVFESGTCHVALVHAAAEPQIQSPRP